MATTTTHYGWDIPQSTDLVKDGATAIATLGQDIDTSVYTALGGNKSGLVLLNTTSFSAVASQSINSVFSSTYTNYKVVIQNTNSTSNTNSIRLRASASDLSTSVYNYANYRFRSGNTAAGDAQAEGQTSAVYSGDAGDDGQNYYTLEFSNPQVAANTNIIVHGVKGISTAGFTAMGAFGGIRVRDNFQADGFTIFVGSGTMTGTVSVYGYNK